MREVRRTLYGPKRRCNFAHFCWNAGLRFHKQCFAIVNVHIGFSDFAGLSVDRCVKQAMLAGLCNEMWHYWCTLTCIEYICSALASLCHSLTHCVHTVYNGHQRNAKVFWTGLLHIALRYLFGAICLPNQEMKICTIWQSVDLLLLSQLYRMLERSE